MRGIYKIENRINGKVYIGESLDIHKRWELHISELSSNTHHNYKLQEDWNKYGQDNFEFTVIVTLDDNIKKLVDRHITLIYENIYIRKFNSINEGYNIEDSFAKVMNGDKRVLMVQSHLLKYYQTKVENNFYVEDNGIIRTDYYSMEQIEKELIIKRPTMKRRMIKLNMVVKENSEYVLNIEYFNKNDISGNNIYGTARFNHNLYNQIISELSLTQ